VGKRSRQARARFAPSNALRKRRAGPSRGCQKGRSCAEESTCVYLLPPVGLMPATAAGMGLPNQAAVHAGTLAIRTGMVEDVCKREPDRDGHSHANPQAAMLIRPCLCISHPPSDTWKDRPFLATPISSEPAAAINIPALEPLRPPTEPSRSAATMRSFASALGPASGFRFSHRGARHHRTAMARRTPAAQTLEKPACTERVLVRSRHTWLVIRPSNSLPSRMRAQRQHGDRAPSSHPPRATHPEHGKKSATA
jgi:hypothetical protein